VKKSAKSRSRPGPSTGRKSGQRGAKPQPQSVGRTVNALTNGVKAASAAAITAKSASRSVVVPAALTISASRMALPTVDPLSWFARAPARPVYRPQTDLPQTFLPQASRPSPTVAVRTAASYDHDDRSTVFLMMVPFFVIALSLGISQTVKPFMTSLPTAGISARAPIMVPVPPVVMAQPTTPAVPVAPVDQAVLAAQRLAAWTPPALPWPRDLSPPRIDAAPPLPVSVAPLPRPAPPIIQPVIIAPPVPVIALPDTPPLMAPPATADAPQVCERAPQRSLPVMGKPSVPPQSVGLAIASAAFAQTKDFVIYSAKYRRLSYPMGDMASFYGACSDVVIRAYRTIGLDLQELVQRTRVGRGDPNIDHRRTETLRKFFTQYGESLTPTAFPEDYQPGDIVTYYRPHSRVSRAHIAVVSDVRAPTGRFMIVHNRGWGPQLEDALFVDRITGHYRFDGTKLPPPAETQTVRGAVATAAARSTGTMAAVTLRPLASREMSRIRMITPTSAVIDASR
jgi:uncharacterized protein YijF (DUF1287 family)